MKCNVCGFENWKKGVKVQLCLECGFVKAADEFYSEDIDFESLYDESYYNGGDYVDYSIEVGALKKNFSDRLKIIEKYLKPKSLMLEIGSGYGYFLDLAQNKYNVSGVERNPLVAKSLEDRLNIKIYGGDFNSINLDKKFDGIVSLDTIEHIAEPEKFIDKCSKLLKKDGYLFLETGDIDGLLPKIRGEKWRLVHPPEHLSYFSLKTLIRLLERNSFEIVYTKRVSFWRSLAQVLYRVNSNLYAKFPMFIINVLKKVNFPLNTFDLIFIVAKKIS